MIPFVVPAVVVTLLVMVSPLSTRVLPPVTSIVPVLVTGVGSIVSVPLMTLILLELTIVAPVMKLVPVESSSPDTLMVPPPMVVLFSNRNPPLSIVNCPAAPMVTIAPFTPALAPTSIVPLSTKLPP